MHIGILAWDLAESGVTLEELRRWVATKAAAEYAKLPGVRMKTWFSDELRNIWGAVYIVDSIEDVGPDKIPRLPDGRTGPIGTRPTSVAWFDMEACVIGSEDPAALAGLGLARRQAIAPVGNTDPQVEAAQPHRG